MNRQVPCTVTLVIMTVSNIFTLSMTKSCTMLNMKYDPSRLICKDGLCCRASENLGREIKRA